MSLIVETTKGKVEGFEKNGVDIWLGIPHSKPPVGALRFKRAQPMDAWGDVKVCHRFGNKPIQFPFLQFGKPIETVPESEDCLYLNIWKPSGGKKLPVFVWIYGGSRQYHHCGRKRRRYGGLRHVGEPRGEGIVPQSHCAKRIIGQLRYEKCAETQSGTVS